MKLILTRHGETLENKEGILQGHLQGRLSELGKDQARKLAFRLKNEKIDFIYSSDLARAADTAREIAKCHPDTPLNFVQELREMDLKGLTGKNKKEVRWEESLHLIEDTQCQRKRVKKIMEEAYSKYPDGTILFVAHSGIISSLLAYIMNKDPDYVKGMKKLGNTSVSIVKINPDGNHKIILLDCMAHLE